MRVFLFRLAIALGLTLGMGVITADAKLPNAYFRFGRITITNQPSHGLAGFSCYVGTGYPRSASSGQFEGDGNRTARLAMENIVETLNGGVGGGFMSVSFPGTLTLIFSSATGGSTGLQGYGESATQGNISPLSRNVRASFSGFAAQKTAAGTSVSFTLLIPAGGGFSACSLAVHGVFFS